MTFCRFFIFKSSYLCDSTRNLMAGATQRDLDTISYMTGDTLLLEDVSDSEVPPSESQNVLLSQRVELPSVELQPAEKQAVSVPGKKTYVAAVPNNTPRVNESSRSYRSEHYLSRFDKENLMTSHRIVHALPNFRLVFADSGAVFHALETQGFVSSSIRCLQRRRTGEMLITFSSVHMKNAFVKKNTFKLIITGTLLMIQIAS